MSPWPKLTDKGEQTLKEALRESAPYFLPSSRLQDILGLKSSKQAHNILKGHSAIEGKHQTLILKKLSNLPKKALPKNFFLPSGPYVCWEEDTLERILSQHKARVGLLDYPPLITIDKNRMPMGLYGEMLKRLGEPEGIVWNCKKIRVGEAADKVQKGEIDFAVSIFETADRKEKVDFCCLWQAIGVSVVVRNSDRRFTLSSDIWRDGVKVAVAQGEVGHELLMRKVSDESLRLNVEKISTERICDIVERVGEEKCDAAVADSLSCAIGVEELRTKKGIQDLIILSPPLFTCHNGIMVSKAQPRLKDWLQKKFSTVRRLPEIVASETRILESFPGIISRF